MVVFGNGGALPTCVPPLRRAPPPEGERMSFAQLSLLEPHAPMPRLRHVRRPFTPSREVGPYRLPRDIQDQLLSALASFRNRDAAFALAVFIGRFWSAPGRIEQAFPIDRRALANHPDLGLTEAKVRGAIRTLERTGFLDRVEPDRGSRYQRTDTGDLHRKPVCFRLGLSYRASFEIANKRAQERRERQGSARRVIAPAQCLRPSPASAKARGLKSPKSISEAEKKVLMGEIRSSPPPISLNPNLEAALDRWKKAAEGQGLLRSDQRES
jgi:hypothetical protein